MRRIKLIVGAAATMAVLMVMTAAPALADVDVGGLEFEPGGDLTLEGSGGAILGPGGVILFSDDLDDDDIDIGGSGGVSQSFEQEGAVSGDLSPTVSISV